jgi:hypothetical protein
MEPKAPEPKAVAEAVSVKTTVEAAVTSKPTIAAGLARGGRER